MSRRGYFIIIIIIINLFIVDNKNTIKKNLCKYKCSLKNMANLGQILIEKIKIIKSDSHDTGRTYLKSTKDAHKSLLNVF